MEVVQPIRSRSKARAMYDYLQARNPRDGLAWLIGTTTGLRVSDLLSLRVSHVWLRDAPRHRIRLRDAKTGKTTRRQLVPPVQEALRTYCPGKRGDRVLFASRIGRNRPLTRQGLDLILKEAARACGIEEVGTHTMRKTFGYRLYRQTQDVALVQRFLNHSSPSETLRYIGIDQDQMDSAMKDFDLYE